MGKILENFLRGDLWGYRPFLNMIYEAIIRNLYGGIGGGIKKNLWKTFSGVWGSDGQ